MKILLIHNADFQTINKVRLWKKKRYGLGDFYELSLIDGFSNLTKKKLSNAFNYLINQISLAINTYQVDKIIFLSEKSAELEKLLVNLKIKFPNQEFDIFLLV
ncbi:MAG TPA: hypothetical protein VJC17_02845 [Candidatus Dojkabacteria bacterium]|nr:hypothetical protein [Candidatus Dojkabacteria bacterium]